MHDDACNLWYCAAVTDPSAAWRAISGVPVLEWDPVRDSVGASTHVNNFGDLLGPLLVDRILSESDPPPPSANTRRLLTIGSTLHFAQNEDVVWGTGINGKIPRAISAQRLDVRAVRGPWTAEVLSRHGIRVPRVFGDPALLLPRYLPELRTWERIKRHDVLVVPNLNDPLNQAPDGTTVLRPTSGLNIVLRQIAQSQFVVGSSLHAIVIAESLGIPARLVVSDAESPFKYRDYLAGTGRPTEIIARSVDEALDLGGANPPECDLDALDRAFPLDLWDAIHDAPPRASFHQSCFPAQWDAHVDSADLRERLETLTSRVEDAAAAPGGIVDAMPELRSWRHAMLADLRPGELEPRIARLVTSIDSGKPENLALALTLRELVPWACVRSAIEIATSVCVSLTLVLPDGLGHYSRIALRDSAGEIAEIDLAGWNGSDWLIEYDLVLPRAQWRSPDFVDLDAEDSKESITVDATIEDPWRMLRRISSVSVPARRQP